ncbi:MAG TPA: TonB family protein [Pyrinomonadaceae bacterium]|nr:TonB family protein [Pyrinomonadaceae bacterium]
MTQRLEVAVFLSLALFVLATSTNAQHTAGSASEDRDRGVELYKQGDARGAVDALRAAVKRHKDDISAWHYLGLALEQKGDTGSASKAYEKAAKLGDIELDRQMNQAPSSKEIGRALMSIRSQLVEAAESAEKYLALNSKLSKSKREEWNVRASSLRGFADLASDDDLRLYSGKDVTTKARVLNKPEPTYTEEARRNQTTGTVVLRCIFGANGKVFGIRAVSSLPDGLTERAISAARQIRFIPATKDGHPVSMWMELQYNFNLF